MYSGRLPFNPFGSRGPGIFMILKKFFILGQRRNKATKKSEKVKNILSFLVSLWERNDELWNFEALLYGSTHISKVFKCLPLIKLMTLFPYWFARFVTCKNESNEMWCRAIHFPGNDAQIWWNQNWFLQGRRTRRGRGAGGLSPPPHFSDGCAASGFLGTEHWRC